MSLSQPFAAAKGSQRNTANMQTSGSHSLQPETTSVSPAEALEKICELAESSAEAQHLFGTHLLTSQMPHVPLFPVQTRVSQHTELCNLCLPTLEQESITTNSREMWTILG